MRRRVSKDSLRKRHGGEGEITVQIIGRSTMQATELAPTYRSNPNGDDLDVACALDSQSMADLGHTGIGQSKVSGTLIYKGRVTR